MNGMMTSAFNGRPKSLAVMRGRHNLWFIVSTHVRGEDKNLQQQHFFLFVFFFFGIMHQIIQFDIHTNTVWLLRRRSPRLWLALKRQFIWRSIPGCCSRRAILPLSFPRVCTVFYCLRVTRRARLSRAGHRRPDPTATGCFISVWCS